MSTQRRALALGLPLGLLSACAGGLWPKVALPPTRYALDAEPRPARLQSAPATGPVLLMAAPEMAPDMEGTDLHYLDAQGALRSYANSAWSAPPALLLQPLLQRALEETGVFAAVLNSPSAARPDLRLETQLTHLQHELASGRVSLQLNGLLLKVQNRQPLGSRRFSLNLAVERADALAAVAAARQLSQSLATELAAWCVQRVRA
jgi:cholesterol transport system auxiliary component